MIGHQQFLADYGEAVLFAWVFAEQLGVPIPAVPLLLGAGALVGSGRLSPLIAVVLPTAAALTANLIWYELGRRKGIRVLRLPCRISLYTDSSIRTYANVF